LELLRQLGAADGGMALLISSWRWRRRLGALASGWNWRRRLGAADFVLAL
jgi:hypothetical protein